MWATLGRVVLHEDLPPGDLQPILVDILDDFVEERQTPRHLQETIAFRANIFASMVEEKSFVNKSKTRCVLYCLSRHHAWEVLQEIWHFKKLVNIAGAEDVVLPNFLPPTEWEIQTVGPPYTAAPPIAATDGRMANGSPNVPAAHDLDGELSAESYFVEETVAQVYEQAGLERSTEQLPMQHYEGMGIDIPLIIVNTRTKTQRPTHSLPDPLQTLPIHSPDGSGLEPQVLSAAVPACASSGSPQESTQSFPEPPRHPRRVSRRVRPTPIVSDRTDAVIEEGDPSITVLDMTPSRTI